MLGIVLALLFWAAPRAAAEDYDTTLDKLGRLQDLATEYAAEHDGDPILLTLSYTRTGSYNTSMWQLTAGGRDTEFDAYVAEQDAELSSLADYLRLVKRQLALIRHNYAVTDFVYLP